jgi:hypothetical protein
MLKMIKPFDHGMFDTIQFPNVGFLLVRLKYDDLLPIVNEVQSILDREFVGIQDNRSNLAGNIQHEYKLNDSVQHIENVFLPLIPEYDKEFDYLETLQQNTRDTEVVLDSAWVNFQRKHEFNPPHCHSGIMSFALWVDIPYSIEEEKSSPSSNQSNMNIPGHFSFYYTNSLGNICSEHLPIDKEYNGYAVLFPSKMMHGVEPFATSDKFRVSVSGNFKIKC